MKRATERSWTSRTFHDFLGIWAASSTIILLCTHPVCFAPAFCSHVRTKKLDAKSIRSSANALFLSAPLQKNGQSWAVMFSHGWPVERRPCPFLIGLMALGHICAWKQNKIGLNRCQMILMDTDVLTHRNWQHATSEHINYVTFKPWFLKARKTLALSCCKEDRDLPANFIFHKYTGSTCFFGVCVCMCACLINLISHTTCKTDFPEQHREPDRRKTWGDMATQAPRLNGNAWCFAWHESSLFCFLCPARVQVSLPLILAILKRVTTCFWNYTDTTQPWNDPKQILFHKTCLQ